MLHDGAVSIAVLLPSYPVPMEDDQQTLNDWVDRVRHAVPCAEPRPVFAVVPANAAAPAQRAAEVAHGAGDCLHSGDHAL